MNAPLFFSERWSPLSPTGFVRPPANQPDEDIRLHHS